MSNPPTYRTLPDGRIQCRVTIKGSLDGEPFEYTDPEDSEGSQFIWPDEGEGCDPSTYWWTDGNMGCDCNRSEFLPAHLSGKHDGECGNRIAITSITPLDAELPTLTIEPKQKARPST